MSINCLIISDDFTTSLYKEREEAQDDLNEMCQSDDESKPKVNYSLAEDFDFAEKCIKTVHFHCIIIDYGLMGDGDEVQNIEVMQYIFNQKIPFSFGGALHKRYVDNSVKRDFPRLKFMHDKPYCGNNYSDIKWMVEELTEERKDI